MPTPIKIVFAGTPEFAVPYLSGFIDQPDFSVTGVITQPDRPSGRKQILTPSPIKVLAEKYGWPIFQPETMRRDPELLEQISNLNADLLVVVAYGQIIPAEILALFPRGAINVHPSLLPKYRGASPIQSAILAGEKETGISIMLMDDKMDHGPILAQERISLTGDETNESLHFDLAKSGVPLLIATIKKYLAGEIKPRAQDDTEATFCQTITKDDGRIDWQKSALIVKHQIHGLHPWPGAWTELNGERIKIFPPIAVLPEQLSPGTILAADGRLIVGCGQDAVLIKELQVAGKKPTDASHFLLGHDNLDGQTLN